VARGRPGHPILPLLDPIGLRTGPPARAEDPAAPGSEVSEPRAEHPRPRCAIIEQYKRSTLRSPSLTADREAVRSPSLTADR